MIVKDNVLIITEPVEVIGLIGPYSRYNKNGTIIIDNYSKRKSILKPGKYKVVSKGIVNTKFEVNSDNDCIPIKEFKVPCTNLNVNVGLCEFTIRNEQFYKASLREERLSKILD